MSWIIFNYEYHLRMNTFHKYKCWYHQRKIWAHMYALINVYGGQQEIGFNYDTYILSCCWVVLHSNSLGTYCTQQLVYMTNRFYTSISAGYY